MEKVKNIQGDGTWQGHGKTYYKFEYEFESGLFGSAMHITETPPFAVGDEVEVEIKKTYKGRHNIKVSKPQNGQGAPSSAGSSSPAPKKWDDNNSDREYKIDASWAIGHASNLLNDEVDFNNGEGLARVKNLAVMLLNLRDDIVAFRKKHKSEPLPVKVTPPEPAKPKKDKDVITRTSGNDAADLGLDPDETDVPF